MEIEIKNFINVWITAILSICYCYYISKQIPKGFTRLLSLLPILSLFTLLPLSLSSAHLVGPTAFYLVWLGNSKLVLFAFGLGPLSDPKTLTQFLSISLLPINFVSETTPNKPSPKWNRCADVAIKIVLLGIVIRAYDYRGILPNYVIHVLYCCHVYLGVELVLVASSALALVVLGLRIEPQFNDPYLATSLQDFWGRRWNLMVTGILRPTVYLPTLNYSSRFLARQMARGLATIAAFLVSGLMHELIYYYLTRVGPTWEVTWFFVLQGVSTAAEVAAKEAGRWRFPVAVSRVVTLGYVMATAVWLFFPQIVRNGVDRKAIAEYHILVDFARAKLSI